MYLMDTLNILTQRSHGIHSVDHYLYLRFQYKTAFMVSDKLVIAKKSSFINHCTFLKFLTNQNPKKRLVRLKDIPA